MCFSKSQGFKVYTRKRKPKFFYQIQPEDRVPHAFQTAFGGVQSPEVGDYLVMPDGSDCDGSGTPEIYMVPQDGVYNFEAVEKDPKKDALPGPTLPGKKVDPWETI